MDECDRTNSIGHSGAWGCIRVETNPPKYFFEITELNGTCARLLQVSVLNRSASGKTGLLAVFPH